MGNCYGDRFHHIQIDIGDLVDHHMNLCTQFEGPSVGAALDTLTCIEPVVGNLVRISTFQSRSFDDTLNMEEVLLFGACQSASTYKLTLEHCSEGIAAI